jgi:hypothetical protein
LTRRLGPLDILAAADVPESTVTYNIKISAQALAMLMQTRWIPEDQPTYRVKVVGITAPDEDGFSLPLIVSENADAEPAGATA